MNAVWLVRGRQVVSRMRFWTAIIGYDPHDHSIGHRIYLVYAAVFFSLWGFAVLVLLADLGVMVLSWFGEIPSVQAAILITSVILVGVFLIRGYRYARRSPFTFSDEDAALICQTPVDRRQVALAWMLGDWLFDGLPFWSVAVILSYACQQLAAPAGVNWSDLPIYLLTGLRAVSTMLLLHLALMSFVYAFGAIRLRGEKDLTYLRFIPIGVGVCLLLLGKFNPTILGTLLWPMLYILGAGFGAINWITGFLLAIFLAISSLIALYLVSKELNLSRASQESDVHWKFKQSGSARSKIRPRTRLGVGKLVDHLPTRAGVWALIWKDWTQALRGLDVKKVISWLALFGSCLGFMMASDSVTCIWMLIMWGLLIGQVCSTRFRSDLNLWVIFRQLPIPIRGSLLAEIVNPVIGATLLSWLAYGICSLIGYHPSLSVAVLLPGIILCVALAAEFDIVRQIKPETLIAGDIPEMGAVGLLIGLMLAGLPLILVIWVSTRVSKGILPWIIAVLGLLLCLVTAYMLWQLTTKKFKNI